MPSSPHLVVRDKYLAKRKGDTCYGLEDWRRYKSGGWGVIDPLLIKREIQEIAAKTIDRVTSAVVNSVAELVKQCVVKDGTLFDTNQHIIPFKDCVFDLDTWEVKPHSPDYYVTTCLSFDYNPDARCDEWEIYRATLPFHDFLQRFAGYCMTPSIKYHAALWLWGPPGGGKSTYIEGLGNMLGPKACTLSLRDVERSQFGLSRIPGRTLAIANEMPGRSIHATDIINNIISGDTITVERKNRDSFDTRPQVKMIWGMNVLPAVKTEGVGIFRRVFPIHFPAVAKVDENIKEAILANPAAFANWALAGLKEVIANNSLDIPAELVAARDTYRDSNDVMLNFVEDACERNPVTRTRTMTIYDSYKTWCTANGHRAESVQTFKADLDRLGFTHIRPQNVSYLVGLGVAETRTLEAEVVID